MSQFKVYIAEKPSVGKALAERLALQGPVVSRSRTSIEGASWAVCWLSGHVFKQVEPDHYIPKLYPAATKNPATGKFSWSFDTLPIIPGAAGCEWKIVPDHTKKDLIDTVRALVGRASVVVHAGDIDREGQLLVDEVLQEIGCKKPVKRILPTANDDKSIDKALANERDNAEFAGMRDAALARTHSDWLVGMNYSRAVTLRARECGGDALVSIGRVQTPILGLIVARELEIQNFKPIDYFTLHATIAVAAGAFKAKWKPRAGQAGLDDEGRLVDPSVAMQIQHQCAGKVGSITEYKDENKNQGPPLPFSIDEIQKLASRKFGMSMDRTLATVQSLYETHKAVSYPRSDCQYLPTSQHLDAPDILAAVRKNLTGTEVPDVSADVDSGRKSRAFNDKQVTAHHAIVPTSQTINVAALSNDERRIYEEICKRYLAQFMPAHTYRAVSATAHVAGHDFTASGRTTIKPGWTVLYGKSEGDPEDSAKKGDADDDKNTVLPPIVLRESAACKGLDREARKTTPPARFNDETLLDAMVNIHKFCATPSVREHFKLMLDKKKAGGEDEAVACGIGTPATRHTFVPKLIDIELVQVVAGAKKSVQKFYAPTPAGLALVQALPRVLTVPDTSAIWDMAFGKIEAKEITLGDFMASQERQINKQLTEIRKLEIKLPEGTKTRPKAASAKKAAGARRKPAASAGAAGSGEPCEKCGTGVMRKRQSPRGEFYGCSSYPQCNHTKQAA